MIVFDSFLILFLFTLFAISHTILASNSIKQSIAARIGEKIAFYRLFYNVSSFVILAAIFSIAPRADIIIYDLRFPYDIITFGLQVISIAGLLWAGHSIDWKEFLGIRQIERFFRGQYSAEDLDEISTFNIQGAFKYVRHPIYVFSILFMAFRPVMSLFYLLMFIAFTVYFYIGSIYEEKKLVEKFGDRYIEYQKSVPRFFPGILNLKRRFQRAA